MVETATQINYTLTAEITDTAAKSSTIEVSSGSSSSGAGDTSNDFNLIAANCNTNVCFFCQKTFTNVYNCRRHIRTHSGEKPFQCNICGKKFSRQSTLNTHEKIHTGDQIFKCDVCGVSFDVYRHLTEHMAMHRIDKPFTCKTCNKSYSRATVLSQHMKSHSETTVFKCLVCGKAFLSMENLKSHESVHNADAEEESVVQQPIQEVIETYKCYVCGELFGTEEECNTHTQVHKIDEHINNDEHLEQGEALDEEVDDVDEDMDEYEEEEVAQDVEEVRLVNCDQCEEKFRNDAELRDHSKIHSCGKYKCDICDKIFSILSNFNVHKRIHERDKPFRCDVCGKSFRLNKSLEVHKVLHSENDSFDCEICDRSFGRSGSLKIHMKSHTTLEQQRPYIEMCNDDEEEIKEEDDPRDYVYDIIEEKPTYCDICGKKFSRRNGNMRTHKCSKYSNDDEDDYEEIEDQSPTIDIWNYD